MIGTIAAGLMVAFLTGMTYVAYAHPREYPDLVKIPIWACFLVMVVIFAFNAGVVKEQASISAAAVDKDYPGFFHLLQSADVSINWLWLGADGLLSLYLSMIGPILRLSGVIKPKPGE